MASHDLDAFAPPGTISDLSVGYSIDAVRSIDYLLAYNEGYADGFADGVASVPSFPQPVLTNIDPDPSEPPGSPGAFSVDFRTARLTPIEFDITGVGGEVSISVSFADRNEVYVALDVDGEWRWPFDVPADNVIGPLSPEPVHVRMLPRGGWPPCVVHFQVANTRASA